VLCLANVLAAFCIAVFAQFPDVALVPAPAPAPASAPAVAAAGLPAPTLTDCPDSACFRGPTVLITYRSSTISLNTTNATSVDFVTFEPPVLPGLVLLNYGPRLGLYVYKATEANVSVSTLCTTLMQQYPVIQICEADATISLNQQPRAVPNPPPSATPNDPLFAQQYALTAPKIPDVWKGGNYGDKRVRACIIDSGESFFTSLFVVFC
jgi:hypothetical protein